MKERRDRRPSRRESADRRAGNHRHAADPFGEVLPEITRDEEASGWGDRDQEHSRDDWLRDEAPPHHG